MIAIRHYNNDRYVSSIDLHAVLNYKPVHYARDINKWFRTTYLFEARQEFTLPVKNFDYIKVQDETNSRVRGNFAEEYWIRLDFAKRIALDSNSKFKQKFVQWLLTLENKVENFELVSRDMVLALLEMAKLCSYVDNQLAFYKEHKEIWLEDAEPWQYAEFDLWRNRILEIDGFKKVEEKYHIAAIFGKARTKIERLAFLDNVESVRNAMFDYLKTVMLRIDPLYYKSTEKALDLANFTRKMYESFGMKFDLKPRHYRKSEQLDMFRDIENIDYALIARGLRHLN